MLILQTELGISKWKMKVMYFRNMQRGGSYGKNTPENERVYLFSILNIFC
jgi:hypothetical protein